VSTSARPDTSALTSSQASTKEGFGITHDPNDSTIDVNIAALVLGILCGITILLGLLVGCLLCCPSAKGCGSPQPTTISGYKVIYEVTSKVNVYQSKLQAIVNSTQPV
jgi:hypothetical protein